MIFKLKIVAVACLAVLLAAPATQAQELFVTPDTSPDYRAYRHMDECQSALMRLLSKEAAKDTVWRDTSVWVDDDMHRTLPDPIVQIGRICMAKVNSDTLPREFVHLWASGLLIVNRDLDVERMYRSYLDSVPSSQRQAAFRQTMNVYRNARPIRLDVIESLYNRALEEIDRDSIEHLILLNVYMANSIYRTLDMDVARGYINRTLDIIDTLSEQVKKRPSYFQAAMPLFVAALYLDPGFDSLSRSTVSYVNHVGGLYRRITGTDFENKTIIGMTAPDIHGDFFLRLRDSSFNYGQGKVQNVAPKAIPVRGKINLIAFLQGGCHRFTAWDPNHVMRQAGSPRCWPLLSTIRRLKESYPDVEVSIVSRTFGNFASSPALDPNEEADTLARYFLDFHRINGNVVVESTPYFRLPGFDNRRIDTDTKNDINYTLLGKPRTSHTSVILTDENGIIVFESELGGISGSAEERSRQMIEALLSRLDRK